MKKILIGSNNKHKLQEIQEIIPDFQLFTPKEVGIDIDPDETGNSFESNALLKAHAFAHKSGMITIADDSGLIVDALNGAPGIYSHRYCPQPGATDKDRRDFLLQNLSAIPAPRTARFYCAAAIVFPDTNEEITVHGTCEGEIAFEEKGKGGFGYDAVFYLPERRKTLAEVTEAEKNEISHRGNAMRKIKKILEERGFQ